MLVNYSNTKNFPFSGSQLKVMRNNANLTQVKVSILLGMAEGSQTAISDWETEFKPVPQKHRKNLLLLYALYAAYPPLIAYYIYTGYRNIRPY